MNAEILCVGTELLMGDTVNTNAAYLSRSLAGLGINVFYHTVIGDNPTRLTDALSRALSRAELVVTTGGLGPTPDDLTKETACRAMGVPLSLHEPSLQKIRDYFALTGREVTPAIAKQAYLPLPCRVLFNPAGTAPGFLLEKDGKTLIMLPGPPREMKAMWELGVVPYFEEKQGSAIYSRRIRITELGEAQAAEKIRDLLDGKNPTVATYASDTETEIRVTARAAERAAAMAVIDPVVEEICARLGDAVYGVDVGSLEERVVGLLLKQGKTAATAESCTAGLVAARLANVAGASGALYGGFVTYQTESKTALLGLPAERIAKEGVVSAAVAQGLAERARALTGADYGVGVTGYAGPAQFEGDDSVGHVFVAVASARGTAVREHHLGAPTRGRNLVRAFAAGRALNLLRLELEKDE